MADNRANTEVSMRTPLSRVKGLGAAHHGAEHWWLHRVTAVSNVPLVLAFVGIVAALSGRDYAGAVRLVQNPFVAVALVLALISVLVHMRLGLQIVIEDYVHARGWKIVALIANTFFVAAVGALCLFAVLRVALGPAAL